MKLNLHSIKCFFKYFIIPSVVGKDEILARCVLSPIHFKKGNLYSKLLLPRSGEKDVSLLRFDYTDENFCKKFAKKLNCKSSEFIGISTFIHKFIDIINEEEQKNNISAKIIATPLSNNKKTIKFRPIFKFFRGTPMHADLVYNIPVVKDEPATKHRLYAEKLLSYIDFYEDKNPDECLWTGTNIFRNNCKLL